MAAVDHGQRLLAVEQSTPTEKGLESDRRVTQSADDMQRHRERRARPINVSSEQIEVGAQDFREHRHVVVVFEDRIGRALELLEIVPRLARARAGQTIALGAFVGRSVRDGDHADRRRSASLAERHGRFVGEQGAQAVADEYPRAPRHAAEALGELCDDRFDRGRMRLAEAPRATGKLRRQKVVTPLQRPPPRQEALGASAGRMEAGEARSLWSALVQNDPGRSRRRHHAIASAPSRLFNAPPA